MRQSTIALRHNRLENNRVVLLMQTPFLMDPRDALDKTLSTFGIKAADLAATSGINPEEISRYRNKRKDMNSLNLYRLVSALPPPARFYWSSLMAMHPDLPESISPKAAEIAGQYTLKKQVSPFTGFLWKWLSDNETNPQEFQILAQERSGIDPTITQEILAGRIPTETELGLLGAVLVKPDQSLYTFTELKRIRDGNPGKSLNGDRR